MKMKINVISRKLIKPSAPTPLNLAHYKISFIDEFCPPMNVRFLLFFTNQIPNLEQSLAQTLTRFYPLAGRFFQKDHLVVCNDEGAEFVEAEAADVESIDLVRKLEADELNNLLPRQFYELHETPKSPLLSIQTTRFRCGGFAIGACVSHRIFDGASLDSFILSWAEHSAAFDYASASAAAISPSFDSPSLFPRGDLDCTSSRDRSGEWNITICAKRFFFTKEAIDRLRSELRADGGVDGEISRVRAVSAVISRALMSVDRARHGRWRASLVVQAFNMRTRTSPPLAKHSCGNLAVQSSTRTISAAESENVSLRGLVSVLGEGIDKTTSACGRLLDAGEEGLKEIVVETSMDAFVKATSGEVNVIWFSDMSKFEFYKADFGLGKPLWASFGPASVENVAVLEWEEGGGINAWVYLKSNLDLAHFQEDEGIRFFAQLL